MTFHTSVVSSSVSHLAAHTVPVFTETDIRDRPMNVLEFSKELLRGRRQEVVLQCDT